MASPQKDEYRVVGCCGSSLMSVAPSDVLGEGWISVQLTPPSFDSQIPKAEWIGGETRLLPPRPRRTAAYRWSAFFGSTASREMDTPRKKSPEACDHVKPPSVDFRIPLPK